MFKKDLEEKNLGERDVLDPQPSAKNSKTKPSVKYEGRAINTSSDRDHLPREFRTKLIREIDVESGRILIFKGKGSVQLLGESRV